MQNNHRLTMNNDEKEQPGFRLLLKDIVTGLLEKLVDLCVDVLCGVSELLVEYLVRCGEAE